MGRAFPGPWGPNSPQVWNREGSEGECLRELQCFQSQQFPWNLVKNGRISEPAKALADFTSSLTPVPPPHKLHPSRHSPFGALYSSFILHPALFPPLQHVLSVTPPNTSPFPLSLDTSNSSYHVHPFPYLLFPFFPY
ncbi:hypothetical protein Pcinc_029857 [Petrolisthes cinctipes]|uniref:Uncharacterized protein n=1 Tax=Petrolisthes cinctipes TaxID=88211 RepID=A0AAE1EZH9_PETCI|nr:hypothetical protein Pcinc_029857 [Petrolisthes cinctipes]